MIGTRNGMWLVEATRADAEALTAFLLARIDEEEVTADLHERGCPDAGDECCGGPAYVRAQCAAKRSIVRAWSSMPGYPRNRYIREAGVVVLNVFLTLADQYAEHPDFRPEWR